MIKNLFFLVLMLVSGRIYAQHSLLPNDTAVRMGKLPNGLTYYIRHNAWPENRANFYIAQKVGSLQEEDHQRGLAHFLEHMCFNGSDHFAANDLIRYLESIGVQYGSDLNAYTGFEETVYNINNVPTHRQTTLDSCLLILRDWAGGLTLSAEEIDQERGVIYEEWRQTSNSRQRMMERALPILYSGVRYGYRMPIGQMSIVQNFKPQALRDYYKTWYRPDNQGIIVVGDVDVDATEKKIRQLFGNLKLSPNRKLVKPIAVPDNERPIVVIEKDKEQTTNQIDLIFKYDTHPDGFKQTREYLEQKFLKSAVASIVNARMTEVAQRNDCPYFGAQMGDGRYLISKTKRAFFISLAAKSGQTLQSLQAAYAEVLRAARFGVTQGEFERFKMSTLSNLERMRGMHDKRSNDQFSEELKYHFLDDEPYIPSDVQYQTMKQIVSNATLEQFNQTLRAMVPEEDKNMVIVSFNNEAEGNIYPTEEGLIQAVHRARQMQLTPYVDQTTTEPLLATLPTPGKIVKTEKSKKFDYDILTLSNGIKVYLKKTDYNKESVAITGECKGGSGIYGMEDFINFRLFNNVVGTSALGKFSRRDLGKMLTGKFANAGLSIDEQKVYITGSSTPKDMETMFQLMYLSLTDLRKDPATFERMLTKQASDLMAESISIDKAFADSVTATLYGHNPRLRPITIEDLERINPDRILQMAKEQTASAGAFEFTVIGNFEMDSIRPLLERYLGSLPAGTPQVGGKRTSHLQSGIVKNHFTRPMDTPKAQAVMTWHSNQIKYTQKNAILADVAGQILSMIYLDKIREKASAAYSVSARGYMTRYDDGTASAVISADCPMQPEKSTLAQNIMREELEALALHCDASMLDKVKQLMLKQSEDRTKTNGYWSSIIQTYRKHGLDWHTNRKQIIASLQPNDVSRFIKDLLKSGNRIEVSMTPEP